MKLLYNIGIKAYGIGVISSAILQNKKARQWLDGRAYWQKAIEDSKLNNPIWLHVSSLGEYIMAKPLIERILKLYEEKTILLTFFSPSGYLNTNVHHKRIIKHYLPLDTASNAKEFINLTNPCIAIFAKYDFWFNYIIELQQKKIPTLVFSASLNKSQIYFKPRFKWQKKLLQRFSKILTVNETVNQFLQNEGFTNSLICGDTRFDQVGITKIDDLSEIIEFIHNRKCIVLGSSWKKEEKFIQKIYSKISDYAIIVAPHDTSEKRLLSIESTFNNKTARLSTIKENNNFHNILIIDKIGILSQIYQLSDIAFIGGGFSGKLHNILEPAATKNVVIFGDNYKKYPEASELISINGAISIKDEADLFSVLKKVEKTDEMENYKAKALKYIDRSKGATEIIFNEIEKLI